MCSRVCQIYLVETMHSYLYSVYTLKFLVKTMCTVFMQLSL